MPASKFYSRIGRLAYESLLELATEEGINASGKEEVYGCIFGRDSAITVLKILRLLSNSSLPGFIDRTRLVNISRRTLLTLIALQGKEPNIESGEEPGKFIHEYRKENYERLTKLAKPWYIYPDSKLRNYDSLDATPLTLIAIHEFFRVTGDADFLLHALPAVERGLEWILNFGDKDGDFLLEYELPEERTHGGLTVQSWTDSVESIRLKDGTFPLYPIAPVEVQGYAWLAVRIWSDFYKNMLPESTRSLNISGKLSRFAQHIKRAFNRKFIYRDKKTGFYFAAQALDGKKKMIKTVTGNPLLLLWATFKKDTTAECILSSRFIPHIVRRSFLPDMVEAQAGIRTMSTLSPTFNPGQDSYHNGSFWPKLNGMAHEGLLNWNFRKEAERIQNDTLYALDYFKTPIELYIKLGPDSLAEYKNPNGQIGCKKQAWSAAVMLDLAIPNP